MNVVLRRLGGVGSLPRTKLFVSPLFVITAVLGLTASSLRAEDPPADKPAEKPATPTEKPAERTTAPQPSLDELFGNRVPQETPQQKLDKVAAEMRRVQDELKGQKTGKSTQDSQQKILDILDELLKTPPQQNPPPSSSGGGGGGGGGSSSSGRSQSQGGGSNSRNNSGGANQQQGGAGNSGQKPEGEGAGQSQTKPSGPGKDRQNAEDSEERNGAKRDKVDPATRRKRLEVDIWGHLPDKLREQLLNSYGERMLPQYEEQVRRFYDLLADPQGRPRP